MSTLDKKYHSFSTPSGSGFGEAEDMLFSFLSQKTAQGERLVKVHIGIASLPGSFGCLDEFQRHIDNTLQSLLPERNPAVTVVLQKPLQGGGLNAEVWSVSEKDCSVKSFQWEGLTHVCVEDEGFREWWTSGFQADYDKNDSLCAEACARRCFEKMYSFLTHTNTSFDAVFRQWNYIGHILKVRVTDGKTLQNYQLFNEVRGVFYETKKDKSQYPAATGIGMDYEGICIDAVIVDDTAATTEKTPRNTALRSPVQADAFRYEQAYLVGNEEIDKKAPLFERGRCLSLSETPDSGGIHAVGMVSGTASIKGQDTVDKGDVEKQLQNTLRFIDELAHTTHAENLRFDRARLYVKPHENTEELAEIFRRHYPQASCLSIVEADVCRPDLLVEIEADFSF